MKISALQKSCKDLLARVKYPRVGTIIGLQEELGKLAGVIMDLEIYGRPFDRSRLEKNCSEVFFSFIDLCNSYDIELDKVSKDRIEEMQTEVARWEKEHGESLQDKRGKFD